MSPSPTPDPTPADAAGAASFPDQALADAVRGFLAVARQRAADRVRVGDWVKVTASSGVFEKLPPGPHTEACEMRPGRPMVCTGVVTSAVVALARNQAWESVMVRCGPHEVNGRRPAPGAADPPLVLPCPWPGCRHPRPAGRPFCPVHQNSGGLRHEHLLALSRRIEHLGEAGRGRARTGPPAELAHALAAEVDALQQFLLDGRARLDREREAAAAVAQTARLTEAELERLREAAERAEFERLQAKFGGKPARPAPQSGPPPGRVIDV